MKSCVRVAAVLLAVLVVATFSVAQDADQKAATDVAQQWLAMVDAGHYGQSWDAAASLFQSKITKPDWESALDQVRSPLGKVDSRQFKSADFETTLSGAPEGKYCVLQFRTKFKTGAMTIETITPMLDNGQWKVSGYLIKPADK
jgi:opacity protein-like surface antigen